MKGNWLKTRGIGRRIRYGDIAPVVAMVAVLALVIFPLPPVILDFALAANITIAALVLALSLFVPHALHLSTFPTLLLITTLFRLGLNIASTRQILLNGYAGEIITAFGQLVVGGNVIVGLVVFIIIAIIQFIVVAKGSDRVAEVGARFSLDAMPGKQMSIDADVRAGTLGRAEAMARRRQLEQTSQFYGAMDGATKFVKGDAIAGLLIAFVNIVGGMLIGTVMNGHPLADTAQRYTVLTVGDGLVSQIPSLLISFAAGILITRVASPDSDTSVGSDIGTQIAAQPKALFTAAAIAAGFALIPGFPTIAFLLLAAALTAGGFLISRARVAGDSKAQMRRNWARGDGASASGGTPADAGLSCPLRVRVNAALLSRLSETELDWRLDALRDRFRESGVPYPGMRLTADKTLAEGMYAVEIDEVVVARGTVEVPRRGRDGIKAMQRTEGEGGATDAATKPAGQSAEAHLIDAAAQTICQRPWQFLGIQETSQLMDRLGQHYPRLMALVFERTSLPVLRDVLIGLLKAGLHIRNLRAIAEGVANSGAEGGDVGGLVASVRTALANQISEQWSDEDGELKLVVMSTSLEAFLRDRYVATAHDHHFDLSAETYRRIVAELLDAMRSVWPIHQRAVLVTGTDLRRTLEDMLRSGERSVSVVAVDELAEDRAFQIVHTIEIDGLETEAA
ncbi:flagellar biosynthesis protein FlhA [Burkholderia pyrrocinia]|uniref:flagellar biosynthesis protein FlhA n=1 Tax=Burkholderia pyrrocinia TaxID=60550 RepID=UPI00105072C7|nr:flagellar biosynthesis protein FlhA [Burkholderia pyrrocinia]TDA48272.1 type III secretion protein [Burkholderia pyrrocinia]